MNHSQSAISRNAKRFLSAFVLLCIASMAIANAAPAKDGASTPDPKPTVAVLGLEVINNGKLNRKNTDVAQQLTLALRDQASSPSGKYVLAPNSGQSLLELKLLSSCSDEGRECMAAIGLEMGADYLLYGKVQHLKKGYHVSLKLLNVATQKMEKTTKALLPTERFQTNTNAAQEWAQTTYADLVGDAQLGILIVQASVETGTIYVDGNIAATLQNGSAKVLGLSEGVHAVAVDAVGYNRYKADVAIARGGTETLSVSLTATGSAETAGFGWKPVFYSGLVVTAGMGAGWAYYGTRYRTWFGAFGPLEDRKQKAWSKLAMSSPDAYAEIVRQGVSNSCGHADNLGDEFASTELSAFVNSCKAGEKAAFRSILFGAATGVAALATAFFAYKSFGNKEEPSSGITFLPTIGEHSIGAGLSLEF